MALASWSPTASSPCISHYVTINTRHFSVYTSLLSWQILKTRRDFTPIRSLLQNVPVNDKLIILGDFKARVARGSEAWKCVLDKHGVGNCSKKGTFFLNSAQSSFPSPTKDSLKTTGTYSWSKHWHLIDYVVVRRRGQ